MAVILSAYLIIHEWIISTIRYGNRMASGSYNTPFPLLRSISLLSQKSRINKFGKAINELVTSDSFVLDIGTGTGILAFIAAKAGAKSVVGIDSSKENIHYARRVAKMNGFDDQVRFFHTHFEGFELERKADVIICEMLSSILLIEQQIPALAEATNNLLAKNGLLIPSTTTVYIVPVQSEFMWNRFSLHGLQFHKMPQTVMEQGQVEDLADMQELFHIEYRDVEKGFRVDKRLDFEIVEDGTIHGVIGMFQAKLIPEVILRPEDGWKQLFIPLQQEREVKKGERVKIHMSYTPGEFDSISLQLEC